MSESAREYPRPDLVLPPFPDMADTAGRSILARLDAYPSGEGFGIARRQATELRACMDARCEATGHRDPALDAVSSRLDAVIARIEGAEPVVTADMIRAAESAPMPSQVPGGSRLEAIVSANLDERRSALEAIEADPAAYANLPERLREDRAIALAAVRANAENFDKVPDELRKNSEFRRESMRTNPLVARRWSYYEHADSREVRLVFDQVERSPSLLAGMRPEIIVQFLVQRAAHVRPEHFSVLPDWHLSVTIRKLLARNPAVTSFGSPENPITLSDVVRDMRPQILFDIERGAQSSRGARDETKLAASARYAASLFRDSRVFEGAPDIFPETIRDAVPSALWADPVYVRHLLVALGMESFPPALLSAEVRTSLGLPDMFEGSQIGELSRVRTIADLLASPNLLLSLEADPSLVRALPLATQNDGPVMAYLIERVPAIVTGRFLSSEALAQREVIRACHSMLDAGSGTGSVPLDYERLTVADMSDLATAYGKGITLDLRFLERIESGMSQGRQDATEWKNLYERLYDQERQLVSGVRSILYRSKRTV